MVTKMLTKRHGIGTKGGTSSFMFKCNILRSTAIPVFLLSSVFLFLSFFQFHFFLFVFPTCRMSMSMVCCILSSSPGEEVLELAEDRRDS
jgi:hypothetical protein